VLQDSVIALVERAVKCGPVVIITNAETGWVELSCKKFMPRVLPFLASVKVLSARSTFEALFPDSPADWKVGKLAGRPCRHVIARPFLQEQAFRQEICTYGQKRSDACIRNILSFGDSIHERLAIHKAHLESRKRSDEEHQIRRKTDCRAVEAASRPCL